MKNEKQPSLPLITEQVVRHYYVDESGDPALFNAKGKIIVGSPGCSSHFFLGLLSVFNPSSLERDLALLHKSLLSDSYFRKKASFLEKNRKTFFGFHAKADLPEVRDLVFGVLTKQQFRFFGVVKDKIEALSYVLQKNHVQPNYKYNQNHLYDHLVYRLFETRVHKNYVHNVYFSQRGPIDRTAALKTALLAIQEKANINSKAKPVGTINIMPPASPFDCVNLQAVDYCLWAVQRFYVKKEDKYLKMIWPMVSMIHEMDSKTGKKRGATYAKKQHPFGVLE